VDGPAEVAPRSTDDAVNVRRNTLQLVTDALPALVSYLDADRRYRFCNKGYEEWFGRPVADVYGRTPAEVLGEEAYETIREQIDRALSGERVDFDAWMAYRDGAPRYVHADYVPDVSADGTVIGFFALITDITQRRRDEIRTEALADAMRELAQAAFDFPTLLERIVERVTQTIGDGASVRLVSSDGRWLETAAIEHRDRDARDLMASLLESAPARIDEGSPRPIFADGADAVFLPNLTTDQARTILKAEYHPFLDRFGMRGTIVVPMRHRDRTLGVITAIRTTTAEPYTADDLRFLRQLADGAALAVHNARLHEELRQSEEHHRLLAEAVPALIVVAHADGSIELSNQRHLEYTGKTHEELRDFFSNRVIHPDDEPQAMAIWGSAIAAGEPVQHEMRLRRHDGVYRWHLVQAMPMRRRGGEIERWTTVSIDIEDRKAAERERQRFETALLTSESHYRSLVEAAPAIIVTNRPDGTMEYCSHSYLEYTGFSLQEALDYESHSAMHPTDQPRAMKDWAHSLATNERLLHEVRLRRHDGVYRWFLVNSAPVRDAGGNVTRWIGVSVDIEDRKTMEQERERWMRELERANAAKDEFLGLVSHELRTPITTIYGNAQVLRRSGERIDATERTEALFDIESEADRLQRIIENMLILARVDSGQPAEAEPVPIVRTIEAVAGDHTARFPSREIIIEADEVLPLAAGQSTYVELIVRNLLSNAEKYGAAGSPIMVRAQNAHDAVHVSVADECGGIAPLDIEQLFMPFFRSQRTAGSAPGAGIGLAVCQRLVEAMDGRIWATSDGERGCEITFSLPLDRSG
jgi:PAS domain S-box-containing protein